MQRFNEATERTTMSNLYLTQEMLKLLSAFRKKGIPAIPYKGPVLAQAVYGNVGLRQFGDLDITVPEDCVP